jgi:hypothetical protein
MENIHYADMTIYFHCCGLHYRHITIVNDNKHCQKVKLQTVVSFIETLVVIYDRNMFKIQATGVVSTEEKSIFLNALSFYNILRFQSHLL